MTKVLIACASRHGGTRGIAERIGAVLSEEGVACRIASVETDPDPSRRIGQGGHQASWLVAAPVTRVPPQLGAGVAQ
jgi:menaquinone-dependent protoporphyrinogen IX oxidase